MYERVGPYKILRLIRKGGQGSVYLGYDARLHRRVAIKIYELPPGRAARRALLREARTIAGIHSPKVVAIHDVIESAEHLALVMEYVPGCNLEEFLQQVHPSMASVMIIARDVAGALALARQNQIVHGDLKPANILISDEGRAKLADFGIARKARAGSAVTLLSGSYSAVSPEQYRGEPLDHRSDLFALGCLLYRLLTGEHPFYRDGRLDTHALLSGSPPRLRDRVDAHVELPDRLEDLVERLLRKNPADRPRTTRGTRLVIRHCTRRLPLSAGTSLLEEAKPCFRPESPEDLPLRIPRALGRSARSRLPPSGGRIARLKHLWRGMRWPGRLSTLLVAGLAVWLPLDYVASQSLTPIQFREFDIKVKGNISLPDEVSQEWMLSQVRHVLREELGNLYVIGDLGKGPITTFYSEATEPVWPTVPEAEFALQVHCVEGLCVLDVTRNEAGEVYAGQGFLLPGMSAARWRDALREATRDLYR